ncbi:hypothetical protein F4809DRAFT_473613 [Biscogniauxia mediterranea]|nr:hypothetical protein F4809DRAFT_473613 [Biscogniauxia mediterranea]
MHAFQIHHHQHHHHCHRWRHYVVIIPGFVDLSSFPFFPPFDVLVLQCSDFPWSFCRHQLLPYSSPCLCVCFHMYVYRYRVPVCVMYACWLTQPPFL